MRSRKIRVLLTLIVCSWHTGISYAQAEWTVLIFAQANNSLHNFAHKNFNDMATFGSNKKLNLLVQWHQPKHEGTWRYKINKGKLNLEQCIKTPTDGSNVKDLVGSMQWAVQNYPAKKYCLILWNHGLGIIDPVWGNTSMRINPHALRESPRIQLAGITQPELQAQNLDLQLSSTQDNIATMNTLHHRGILFNERTKTYMNNQQLSKALSEIKHKVLKNKKIDLLGMDACLMAMVEIGYQIRNYANYLVASQEVELAYGWNYKTLTASLHSATLSPVQLAQSIVTSYESLYKKQIQFYTQSAIDLTKINDLKTTIDNVITSFASCALADPQGFKTMLKKARNSCLRFSTASYIDLHSFFDETLKQAGITYERNKNINKNQKLKNAVKELKQSLQIGKAMIEDTVIAHTAGRYYTRARGLSIYFPVKNIDRSYGRTEFASDSLWYSFLQNILGR